MTWGPWRFRVRYYRSMPEKTQTGSLGILETASRLRFYKDIADLNCDAIGFVQYDVKQIWPWLLKFSVGTWACFFLWTGSAQIVSKIPKVESKHAGVRRLHQNVSETESKLQVLFEPFETFSLKASAWRLLLARVTKHWGPSPHIYYAETGYVLNLVKVLSDPLLSPLRRQKLIELLEVFTSYPPALEQTLNDIRATISVGGRDRPTSTTVCNPELQAADWSAYHGTLQEKSLLERLYCTDAADQLCNGTFPRYIQSTLYWGFWPLLRLLVTPSNLTWGAVFEAIGYRDASQLCKELPFTDLHHRSITLLRVVLDIVAQIPPQEREVPLVFLQALVNGEGSFWSSPLKREEYRAHLLRLLLENEENALKVFDAEAVLYALRESPETQHSILPEHPCMILSYLNHPVSTAGAPHRVPESPKSTWWTQGLQEPVDARDIHYASLSNINKAVMHRAQREQRSGTWFLAIPAQPPERVILCLPNALRATHFLNTFYYGALAALGSSLLLAQKRVPGWRLMTFIVRAGAVALGLEAEYFIHENCLNHRHLSSMAEMLLTVAFVPINAVVYCAAVALSPYSLLAFVYNRCVGDTLNDAFRNFPATPLK